LKLDIRLRFRQAGSFTNFGRSKAFCVFTLWNLETWHPLALPPSRVIRELRPLKSFLRFHFIKPWNLISACASAKQGHSRTSAAQRLFLTFKK